MLTLAAGASAWPAAIFSTKNHVPGDPPANHIAGGVERIDPGGAAVYVCLVADRWPAAHAGESTPDRYADGSLLLYLAFIATLVGYGIWGSLLGRYETWRVALSLLVPVVDGQRCAAAGGDAERTAARRGGADHGRALYQRFRSASGAAWHGARVKKAPETGLYTSMRVMASQVVLLVVRHAKFVRFIIAGRHMIEIKRRVVMFRRRIIVSRWFCRTEAWWFAPHS